MQNQKHWLPIIISHDHQKCDQRCDHGSDSGMAVTPISLCRDSTQTDKWREKKMSILITGELAHISFGMYPIFMWRFP